LNIKSLDEKAAISVRLILTEHTRVFPADLSSKYVASNRAKVEEFRLKDKGRHGNEKGPEETYKEAMKRAFAKDTSNYLADYSLTSNSGTFLNRNTYIKLLNGSMDPNALVKQAAMSGPDGVRFLLSFLANQCSKLQKSMQSLALISSELTIEASISRLFDIIVETINARYGTIYYIVDNNYMVYISNWQPAKKALFENDIFGSNSASRREILNVSNFKTPEYFDTSFSERYNAIEPNCLLSAPFYGEGKKVAGIIELIGRNVGNPIFDSEDEMLINAFAGLTTIVFGKLQAKNAIEIKHKHIDDFMAAASSMKSIDTAGFLS
jgi:hypothetical protein